MSEYAPAAGSPSAASSITGVPKFVQVKTDFDSGMTPTIGKPSKSSTSAIDNDSSA
eukprot:CAMPEP_0171306082 /NCGR_PEP_ID=MMETSP0816-20121228/16015_1 /TAXON_ID=420281 /ORGANISM="Proboscia inermis, Strain CCAP1064/1" /LENGTH=55 /DNA_ID=CAMNT_0011787411 /DNA_START=263 /DNA_END=430 /DNA_ORIENTATION=-